MRMSRNSHRHPCRITFVVLVLIAAVGFGAPPRRRTAHPQAPAAVPAAVDVARDPADVPQPVGNRPPTTVRFTLTAKEVEGKLDPDSNATYSYWTFDGTVPGPMLRVRQGDTVEITLKNDASCHMPHSIDLHAAIGSGGGAMVSQTLPGAENAFTFTATTPGLFVYHCGTPDVAEHIANGMYGLILVEPSGGLPPVAREYYVMQGEIYTSQTRGTAGALKFDMDKLLAERPEYYVFNGAVGALDGPHALSAETGDTIRIFFGNAGPNRIASPHVMGGIFSHVAPFGSLTANAVSDVQTALVPPGGAAILELKAVTSGDFGFVDHAIGRAVQGLMGMISVHGAVAPEAVHSSTMKETAQ